MQTIKCRSLSKLYFFAFVFVAIEVSGCALKRSSSTAVQEIDETDGLSRKLERQWKKFEETKTYFVQKAGVAGETISRDEWEKSILLADNDSWTDAEVEALKRRQNEQIAETKAANVRASVIDLTKIRNSRKEAEFCKKMPKGGMLHIHPWGTVDQATAETILQKVNPTINFQELADSVTPLADGSFKETGMLYPEELATLKSLTTKYGTSVKYNDNNFAEDRQKIVRLYFLPPGPHEFSRFTATFTIISKLTFSNPAVDPEPIMYEAFLARAKANRISYVEISITARSASWLAELTDWEQKMRDKYGVTVRLIAAFNRTKAATFTKSKALQLLQLPPSPILVGINLLADESVAPALETSQMLYGPVMAAVSGGTSKLQRTIHAGELGDPRNVRDAILMGAQRLGHAVNLKDDPITLEYARLKKVPVEINLLSNYRLKVVDSIEHHPFLDFLRSGLPASLATDDEGLFETTLSDECVAALNHSDINYAELRQMAENSLTTSFADEETKNKLIENLQRDLRAFENEWRNF